MKLALRLVCISFLVACGSGESSSNDVALATEATTAAPLPVRGLMKRSGPPDASFFDSTILMLDWDTLEHDRGVFNWKPIEDAVGPNGDDGTYTGRGITRLKLRVMAGPVAPSWARKIGLPGGHIDGVDASGKTIDCNQPSGPMDGGIGVQNIQGQIGCIPKFWNGATANGATPPPAGSYLDAYSSLMHHLAAHLDANPTRFAAVTTVVDSACMAIFAEVFYRGQGEVETNRTLYDAGLRPASDADCQKTAVMIHKSAFGTKRRTAIAVNDWDLVDPSGPDYRVKEWYGGAAGAKYTFATYEFTQWATNELGAMVEFQNNGLHSTTSDRCSGTVDPTKSYWCFLEWYTKKGRAGFQTQSWVDSKTLFDDLDNGIANLADFIELPSGYSSSDLSSLGCYDRKIKAGLPNAITCPRP
jgi:hypothetical protein